jgi:hypothetical protein
MAAREEMKATSNAKWRGLVKNIFFFKKKKKDIL